MPDSQEEIISTPRPSIEERQEAVISFVEKLETGGIIGREVAEEWKGNLRRSFDRERKLLQRWYKNKVEIPGETIYEIVTAQDNAGFGLAVAEIEKSQPHYHLKTHETYTLISGILNVHIGESVVRLIVPGKSVEIPMDVIHWAEKIGEERPRISVLTVPAWVPEDHHLIES